MTTLPNFSFIFNLLNLFICFLSFWNEENFYTQRGAFDSCKTPSTTFLQLKLWNSLSGLNLPIFHMPSLLPAIHFGALFYCWFIDVQVKVCQRSEIYLRFIYFIFLQTSQCSGKITGKSRFSVRRGK